MNKHQRDRMQLEDIIAELKKQKQKDENYFSVICETLEIDHKSSLTEIQKAIITLQENPLISQLEEVIVDLKLGSKEIYSRPIAYRLQKLIDNSRGD